MNLMVEVVTIANFENAIAANFAKQNLEAEGITAFLADEATVNVAWYLSVAVRWIKLQVPEPEVGRAVTVLAATGYFKQIASPDLAKLISEEMLPSGYEEEPPTTQDSEAFDDEVRLSWADRTVDRIFRVAVLGLIFFPLHLYSLWLLIRLLVARRRITRGKYWKVITAVILHIPIMTILGIIFF